MQVLVCYSDGRQVLEELDFVTPEPAAAATAQPDRALTKDELPFE